MCFINVIYLVIFLKSQGLYHHQSQGKSWEFYYGGYIAFLMVEYIQSIV